ncbi:MAG: hypothetical protein AAF349_01565 [Cyanobacteria bacterium P01_A01_bin.68]
MLFVILVERFGDELLSLKLEKAGGENIKQGRVKSKAEITLNLLLAFLVATLGDTTI